jgi:hypothetical protein
LAVERARQIGEIDFPLAFVRHLHVAAERYRRQRPFGAVAAVAARPDHPAEADRETEHLDACKTRDDVVAELVKHDEHAEGDREGDDFVEGIDHCQESGIRGQVTMAPACPVARRAPR